MSFGYFTKCYEVHHESADWDEASRRYLDGQVPESSKGQRALCDCGLPLFRYARVPSTSTCLLFTRAKECDRCDNDIEPGEMHFACTDCDDVSVCKECGPGVYVQREYDFYNTQTHEMMIETVPSRVIHKRGRKTRSVGALEPRCQQIAKQVIDEVQQIMLEVSKEQEDVHDKEWQVQGLVFRILGAKSGEESASCLIQLAMAAKYVIAAQPSLSEAAVPCKIYGDIHGQLRDLLLLFHSFGMPGTSDCPNAVFNGDFVDRGRHQLEVVALLFSLKILFPTHIWLNRGNHEDSTMNQKYGFFKACTACCGDIHGKAVFDAITSCFEYLPLGTVVGGKVLAVHGGIGDGKWTLDEIRQIKRPLKHEDLQDPSNRTAWNILWSDPIEDDMSGSFGVHTSPRSKNAVKFGWNVTQAFCATNGLDLVVRSHQSKKHGLGFDVMHNEILIRVFSARDYEGHANDGAVLQISADEEGSLTVRSQVLKALDDDDIDD